MNGYVVLASNAWKLVDENTGEIKEGVTIVYLDQNPTRENNKKGYFPMKVSVDKSQVKSLIDVPGIYDIQFGFKPDNNGKPKVFVNSLKFLSSVSFKEEESKKVPKAV